MNEITNFKRELGFGNIETDKDYEPLFLQCVAVTDCKTQHYHAGAYRCRIPPPPLFEKGEKRKLWVIRGNNLYGEKNFYFRTDTSPDIFKIEGIFRFEFDAKRFFELFLNASPKDCKKFFGNCTPVDTCEIVKFRSLILEKSYLNSDKLALVEELIGLLNNK